MKMNFFDSFGQFIRELICTYPSREPGFPIVQVCFNIRKLRVDPMPQETGVLPVVFLDRILKLGE